MQRKNGNYEPEVGLHQRCKPNDEEAQAHDEANDDERAADGQQVVEVSVHFNSSSLVPP